MKNYIFKVLEVDIRDTSYKTKKRIVIQIQGLGFNNFNFTLNLSYEYGLEKEITIANIDIHKDIDITNTSVDEKIGILKGYFSIISTEHIELAFNNLKSHLNNNACHKNHFTPEWNDFANQLINWFTTKIAPTLEKYGEIHKLYFDN